LSFLEFELSCEISPIEFYVKGLFNLNHQNLMTQMQNDDDFDDDSDALSSQGSPQPVKNYMTPMGYAAMRGELLQLMDIERPKIVEIVHWAASNGDRSENGDYIYGKKRLREIDKRIRFLTKRLDIAQVVDPSVHYNSDTVFFGATVTYEVVSGPKNQTKGSENTITILGVDEFDSLKGEVSWVSPIAKALIKARAGDEVKLQTPAGTQLIEILKVEYPSP